MIRVIDILASLFGLIVLSPVFLVIAIWIKIDDYRGGVFYKQIRVGKGGKDFGLYKFRSMYVGSDKKGLITVGGRDPRITRSGYYIRKYKLDELPQLINVLKGDMSLVGPRPEVRKYVDLYTPQQRRVLEVRPGITDYASIEYLNENDLLALSKDPDKTYIEEIMPAKIRLNMKYINNQSLKEYLYIIWKTLFDIAFNRLVNHAFVKKTLPSWGVLILDFMASMVAAIIAYAIINDPDRLFEHFWKITGTIALYMPVFCLAGKIFHTYDIKLRYSSFADLQRVLGSMLLGAAIIFVIRQYVPLDTWFWKISGKTCLVGSIIATLMIMSVRVVIKGFYDQKDLSDRTPKAVIYGVNENGERLASMVQNRGRNSSRVIAFITDNPLNVRQYINGCPVYYRDDKIVQRMVDAGVSVLICDYEKSQKIRNDQQFISQLIAAGIKILITPSVISLDGDIHLKEVQIEDLLPRDQIDVNMAAIGKLLFDKTILITGAAGSIGSEMVRQIAQYRPKMMVLIDQAETPLHAVMLMMKEKWPEQDFCPLVSSITKRRHMEDVFNRYRPDYVFHAAAYKHVPMMEMSPANAIQNNCVGTRVIADLSVKYGVKKFVMISTDKAVNPTNVMGCSKRICEIYCQSLNATPECKTQFVTTRFGNVLGSNGSVIPIFREQIKKGGPVTVTHPEMVRFFMLIPEACKLVLQAGTMGKGGEIYVFDMGQPVRIADMAQRMIDLSGAKDVKIKYTGLRDGEKLYEEVLNDAETTLPTTHPKIKVAKVRECPYAEVLKDEEELEQLSYTYDEMAIVRKMKEIVPEFKSQHSRFEALDVATAVATPAVAKPVEVEMPVEENAEPYVAPVAGTKGRTGKYLNSIQLDLLALLRFALGEESLDLSENPDWRAIYREAESQCVIGLLAEAIGKLGNYDTPYRVDPVVVNQLWEDSSSILRRNKAINELQAEVCSWLYAKGIKALAQKGQGVAQCYPNPMQRMCGDIDLLVPEPQYEMAKQLLAEKTTKYGAMTKDKHSSFHFGYFEVELHATEFSVMRDGTQEKFRKLCQEMFAKEEFCSYICEGKKILLAPRTFDAFYIFLHTIKHYYFKGVGLKQLLDLQMFMTRYQKEIDHDQLSAWAKQFGLRSEWKRFTRLWTTPDALLMKIIFLMGNQGQKMYEYESLGFWKRLPYIFRDDYHKALRYAPFSKRRAFFKYIGNVTSSFVYFVRHRLIP